MTPGRSVWVWRARLSCPVVASTDAGSVESLSCCSCLLVSYSVVASTNTGSVESLNAIMPSNVFPVSGRRQISSGSSLVSPVQGAYQLPPAAWEMTRQKPVPLRLSIPHRSSGDATTHPIYPVSSVTPKMLCDRHRAEIESVLSVENCLLTLSFLLRKSV
jgi:hypothetical protein